MLPVVEWCAGKGHLGRILAHRFTAPVTSIEWQAALCRQGKELAGKYKLAQQFICADVLNDSLQQVLQPQQQLVASLGRLTEIAFHFPITNHSLIRRLPLVRFLQQLVFQLVL